MKIIAVIFIHNPIQFRYPLSSVVLWPLMRAFFGSKYNHCCLMCRYQDRTVFIEASAKGIRMTEYDDWLKRAKRETYTIACSKECNWLVASIEKPSSSRSTSYFRFIQTVVQRWFGKNSSQVLFGSEFAAKAIGHPQPSGISPSGLYDYLKQTSQEEVHSIAKPTKTHTESVGQKYA